MISVFAEIIERIWDESKECSDFLLAQNAVSGAADAAFCQCRQRDDPGGQKEKLKRNFENWVKIGKIAQMKADLHTKNICRKC
ncbi:MAG: hypothetical protein IKU34_00505 [Clostridia bacterium]|nr:hypothetical protein [Clostridia bacterium]